MIASLSRTYEQAREAIRTAAGPDAHHEAFVHPFRGIDGEELAVDVFEVGAAAGGNASAPDSAIVVVSGTHGVEGYLGSAIQRHHLTQIRDHGARPSVTTIFVHALNPFGFSWVRRVNEDNVDLNRNFIDWDSAPPDNEGYAEIADLLVPRDWSEAEQQRTLDALLGLLAELGMERAQQIISGGQYSHPTGIFYGGTGPTWSNRWLTSWIRERFASIERLAILDLHTGLGPWGHGELISSEAPGSDALDRARSWFGDVTSIHGDDSVSAEIAGEWLGVAPDLLPQAEVTGVAIEYGTVDTLTVLQSLRADATTHAAGLARSPQGDQVRTQVRAAFVDDDPAWLDACWPAYESAHGAAMAALA